MGRGFEQVVAVDARFDIFSRAWCVAELAAAHAMGMRQHLKLRSGDGLAHNEPRLRMLRIESMEATRAQDKEEILSKIPDTTRFNAALQSLLFEKLLPAWGDLDRKEQMTRVASVLRWHRASSLERDRTS